MIHQPEFTMVAGHWESKRPVVCVDLDGTLISGDLLWESLIVLLKKHPRFAFMLTFWLMRGRAFLKQRIAQLTPLDPSILPYRQDVLTILQSARANGQTLVLATASDELQAVKVAEHLGIFSEVLASNGSVNLSGHRKANRLTERFGARGFDYIGNDWADVPIWSASG